MLRTKNNKYLLVLIIIFLSCNKKKEDLTSLQDKTITLKINEHNDSEILFESLFDSVKFIPIQNTSLIGDIDLMAVKNDSLYLFGDTQFTKTIFLVNNKGNIINSYNYAGKGPEQSLYLEDIKYDYHKNSYIALFQSPNKLICFDDSLKIHSILPLPDDCFRFMVDSSQLFLYAHNDLKLFKLAENSKKPKELFDLKLMDYYPFYPTPVFYDGNYFNVPYDPVVYKLSNDNLTEVIKMSYKAIPKDQPSDEFPRRYPPVINNIYETDNNIIVIVSYNYLMRIINYSKTHKSIISQGAIMDKFYLHDKLFSQNENYIYGTMSSDKFISFYKNYKEAGTDLDDFPKIIVMGDVQNIKNEDNPLLVKYYLKNQFDHEK